MSGYQETKIHGTPSFPYAVYRGLVPDWLSGFPLHWHEEMEIICVQEGSIGVSVGNNDYTLNSGEFILIHPQMIHAIKQHEDRRGLYVNILFRFSMLESGSDDVCREKYLEPIYNRRWLMPEYISLDHPLNTRIMPIILELTENADTQRPGNELWIKGKLYEMMSVIFEHCEASNNAQAYEDIIFEKLKHSLRYIEENYADSIGVDAMAAVSNYSVSHFSKLFKQLTGVSFTQYLKNYRLEAAANRLINENTKISEIALSCGFSNLSYFTRAFYQKYLTTPSQYRRDRKKHLNDRCVFDSATIESCLKMCGMM